MKKQLHPKDWKYTLVQHSGWGRGGDVQFENAVELTCLMEADHFAKVKKAGGTMYDTYELADTASEYENYPPEVKGLIPRVRGTFSKLCIEDLRIYIPPTK